MQKGLIIGMVLALALVIFTLQNPVNVQVKFLFWKVSDVPVALFLVLSVSFGVMIATVFTLMHENKYKAENRRLK